MPAKRLSMRKIKEVLRLTWMCNQSQRQIARQCSLSRHCVRNYLRRANDAGLSWPLPDELDDGQLERLLFPAVPKLAAVERSVPDWTTVFTGMKQKNITKFLLWQEYRGLHPNGYNYIWFCDKQGSGCPLIDQRPINRHEKSVSHLLYRVCRVE